MTNNLIKQFLDEHDYDVRKTHNGRWIDQKCIYDEVCFVSDCIVDYLLNGGDRSSSVACSCTLQSLPLAGKCFG